MVTVIVALSHCVLPRLTPARPDRTGTDRTRARWADPGGADIAARVDVHVYVVVVLALIGFPVEIHPGAATVIS
ncbi:hypothetical protein MHEL_07190 [Mycolicibacterium helvum]|uniref:Uncharacterized protein n=1 Tax=Mycolicibacterium helvum TaxID=1534349 RepID=A0A7I7T313_9MYCO|nr:hypothetical protein MHEL_07190 [Mycolicibacterium helvum]